MLGLKVPHWSAYVLFAGWMRTVFVSKPTTSCAPPSRLLCLVTPFSANLHLYVRSHEPVIAARSWASAHIICLLHEQSLSSFTAATCQSKRPISDSFCLYQRFCMSRKSPCRITGEFSICVSFAIQPYKLETKLESRQAIQFQKFTNYWRELMGCEAYYWTLSSSMMFGHQNRYVLKYRLQRQLSCMSGNSTNNSNDKHIKTIVHQAHAATP